MDSAFIKALKCYQCSKFYLIENINFPENVFELIRQHKLDKNLFWVCDLCKNCLSKVEHAENFEISMNKSSAVYREIDVHIPARKCQKQSDTIDVSMRQEVKSDCSPSRDLTNQTSKSRSPSPPNKDRFARKFTHSILNSERISPKDKSKNKLIVNDVLEKTLLNMKKNEEFKSMMNRLYYTGSAYNDLKITSATEYDINLVLKVPRCVALFPEFFEKEFQFVKLKWESDANEMSSSQKFLKECSDKNYLNPQKTLSWLQHHIDLTLKQHLELPTEIDKITNSSSGPARTIIISTIFGYKISVDLVPVYEFEYSLLPATIYDKLKDISLDKTENDFFFAVPKECTEDSNISVSDSKLCWRLDFPNAEKCILSGKECAKSVIKILKIIRDKKDWKGLASYYLKMVVMLEILKNSSKEHWKNGNMHLRLLDSMKELVTYLANRSLPHFLTQYNLIHKLNENQCINWSNHLRSMTDAWEKEPSKIDDFVGEDKQSV